MNIAAFIARRLTFPKTKSFTKLIINIGITAVALSVTVMIVSTSLFNGFKNEISQKVFNFWGHIHISDSNVKRTFEPIPIEHDEFLINTIKNLESVEFQMPSYAPLSNKMVGYKDEQTEGGVKSVSPFIVLPTIINTKEDFEGIYVRGLDNSYPYDRLDPFLKEGRWFNSLDTNYSKEIVLSSFLAKKLKLSIDDKMVINFISQGKQKSKRLDIVGVYNTGIEEYDSKFAFLDLRILQEFISWEENEYAGYEVILDNLDDMEIMNEYIYVQELPSQLYSETIREKFDNIFGWLNLQDVNERVIFILMIIVAIITMITTYLILILERTKTIGILKSLGATDGDVTKIFLYCAFFIITRGMLIGNALGFGLCILQKYTKFIKLDEANYLVDSAPILFNFQTIILINVGILFLTLVFLLLPSILISQIKPVKILRFN
jgi:lipoprotein-releasing system permease protein